MAKLGGRWSAAGSVVLVLSLSGCDGGGGDEVTLSTHCGIDDLEFEGQWFERVGGLLDDGSGNPPDGWGNPTQTGTVTRLDDSTVLFTDEVGHREEFVLRAGASGAKHACD